MLKKAIHIGCKEGDIAGTVLLPGDPTRVKLIAGYFDEAKKIADRREYTTYTGKTKGLPVTVTSTGIGCPSTAIAIEELANLGARNFIRIGTTGALQENIKVGDIIIATAAVRGDGTSLEYAPLAFPAIADFTVVNALMESCRESGITPHTGIIRTHDAFYRESPYAPPEYKERLSVWKKAGILALDNESSALFVVASLRKLRAGTILVTRGNLVTEDQAEDISRIQGNLEEMIKITLLAVQKLNE